MVLCSRDSGRTLIELAFCSPCLVGVQDARSKCQTTHVDADVGLSSDAGSIPAASTIICSREFRKSPQIIGLGASLYIERPVHS